MKPNFATTHKFQFPRDNTIALNAVIAPINITESGTKRISQLTVLSLHGYSSRRLINTHLGAAQDGRNVFPTDVSMDSKNRFFLSDFSRRSALFLLLLVILSVTAVQAQVLY